ncbi:hypothetical protein D9619_011026 [Psilocybe cf. subviscida]|uniref:Uncharacterized protein n=1 Tax=Psilocybe cf. subviscida TaxID=2480587 RepID=A0A8H5B8H0_9AGAR|nr:hypothetical protein D9619_011026 [Psilocybe cf. subviscida]
MERPELLSTGASYVPFPLSALMPRCRVFLFTGLIPFFICSYSFLPPASLLCMHTMDRDIAIAATLSSNLPSPLPYFFFRYQPPIMRKFSKSAKARAKKRAKRAASRQGQAVPQETETNMEL